MEVHGQRERQPAGAFGSEMARKTTRDEKVRFPFSCPRILSLFGNNRIILITSLLRYREEKLIETSNAITTE
ncbi:hypothetical protein ACS0PU_007732 [Formica fusca]